MKTIIILSVVVIAVAGCGVFAGLHDGGTVWKAPQERIFISWTAPTNDWPETLWVCQTKPAQFSSDFIRELLQLTDMVDANPDNRGSASRRPGRDVRSWVSPDGKRELMVIGDTGWIRYSDQTPDPRGMVAVENVPDEASAQLLALKVIKGLGLSLNDFAKKPGTTNQGFISTVGRVRKFNPRTSENMEFTNRHTIHLPRALDGIPFSGLGTHGGLSVSFGANGKIVGLELVWPEVERVRPVSIPDQGNLSRQAVLGKFRSDRAIRKPLPLMILFPAVAFYYQGNDPTRGNGEVIPYVTIGVDYCYSTTTNSFTISGPVEK